MAARLARGKTGQIDSLTGARFPAIMIIVFAHFEFLYQYGTFGEIFARYFRNGVPGADYFFALSGFGMMLSSMRKDPAGDQPVGGVRGSFRFAVNHIKKTYPLYVMLLLCALPHTFLSQYLKYGKTLLQALVHCLLYFSLDLTLLQSALGRSQFSHAIVPTFWFLSTLFCIYFMSPAIMRFLKRRVKTVGAALLGIAVCIVLACLLDALAMWIRERTIFDDFSHTSPYRRVFFVIPGMLLAQIYTRVLDTPEDAQPRILAGGALEYVFIISTMVWFFLRNSLQETLGSTIFIVDMILAGGDLFALALGRGAFSRFFADRRMVYLGTISQYIYLSHYPVRMYLDAAVQALKLKSLAVGITEAVLMLALTFAISALLYRHSRNRKKLAAKV